MTHLMVEEDLQTEIEAMRMDLQRLYPTNLMRSTDMTRREAVYTIAQLTLAIENGVIA